MSEPLNTQGFAALNLPPRLLDLVGRLGFTEPTPIQASAIPVALTGRDIVGIAQTGTGKTLAFGLPMAARLANVQVGLVLAPTRELALQIQETISKLGLRTALLIGGAPMGRQIRELKARPRVIVATPGRLKDHLYQGTVDLRTVSIAVLDEADRMLDMGFAPAIREILARTPKERQTMLFSATMPHEIAEIAKQYLRDPHRIDIATAGPATELVDQELVMIIKEDKAEMLRQLLSINRGSVLVFARTRHGARKIAESIRRLGHASAEIHSDRTLAQRTEALQGFKDGRYRILVATDIAARGIDVKDISLVINYDVPESADDYVHRIGRTGRAGATGRAITLATPDQHRHIRDIEKMLGTRLPASRHSRVSHEAPSTGRPPAKRGGGNARFRPRVTR